MAKISTRVTFDKKRAAALVKAASNNALTVMGMQAVDDTGKYVPVSSDSEHPLKDSGISSSDQKAVDGKFTMRWSTPYAQYLWHGDVMYGNPTNRTYGPEKISFTSALAREEWAKYAHEVYGAEWRQVYQAALRKEMRSG